MVLSHALIAAVGMAVPSALTSGGAVHFRNDIHYGDQFIDDQLSFATVLFFDEFNFPLVYTSEKGPDEEHDPAFESKVEQKVVKGAPARDLAPVLSVEVRSGLIAPNLTTVENSSRMWMPVSLTNTTGAPIFTALTINASFQSMGTFPGAGIVSHSSSAAMLDSEPDDLVFLGPDNYWFDNFAPGFSTGVGNLLQPMYSYPEAGRWEAYGAGGIVYPISLAPGESIQKWLLLSTSAKIVNDSDAGPAQYDALTDPGLFAFDVEIGNPDVAFDVVPAPGAIALMGLVAPVAARRRRR